MNDSFFDKFWFTSLFIVLTIKTHTKRQMCVYCLWLTQCLFLTSDAKCKTGASTMTHEHWTCAWWSPGFGLRLLLCFLHVMLFRETTYSASLGTDICLHMIIHDVTLLVHVFLQLVVYGFWPFNWFLSRFYCSLYALTNWTAPWGARDSFVWAQSYRCFISEDISVLIETHGFLFLYPLFFI